ncbi:MAG: hypothetical protein K8I30_13060 [Anaerolineae bacterium]|nr:hypothetical protein [Anaerolineae bacterium]
MAHEIQAGPESNIRLMRLIGELLREDLMCDDELGLNSGERMYVLVDASEMDIGLPAGFMDGKRESFFMNPNLAHVAVYSTSWLLNSAAKMLGKLTRQRDKLSVHDTREAALEHLKNLAADSKKQQDVGD